MKIVLVGAGSLQFGLGMLGDIFQSKVLTGCEVTLLDINAVAMERVERIAKEFLKKEALDFTVSATLNRKEAFT